MRSSEPDRCMVWYTFSPFVGCFVGSLEVYYVCHERRRFEHYFLTGSLLEDSVIFHFVM